MGKLFNKKIDMKVHNKYELTLLGPDGKVKQKAYAYNVVLDEFWNGLLNRYNSSYPDDTLCFCGQIGIGTGSGTPAATDTGLFTSLTTAAASVVSSDRQFPTSTFVYNATFAASATYVGTITEVGLRYLFESSSYYYYSHALLQDAEGDPITIVKTDVDTLIVTATVYVTITSTDFVLCPAAHNRLLSFFVTSTDTLRRRISLAITPWLPDAIMNLGLDYRNYIVTQYKWYGNMNMTPTTIDTTAKTLAYATVRMPVGSLLDGHRAWAFWIWDIGYVLLPNTSLFPVYTTANTLVGTGDGVTREFNCPIPLFIENTDVVKIAGITKTRGVDYTIDHANNNSKDFSVAASSRAKIISNVLTFGTYGTVPFSVGFNEWPNSSSVNNFGISDTVPLVLDMGTPVPCNTLYISKICGLGGTATATIYLERSDDNENWFSVLTIASGSYSSTTGAMPPGGPEFTFAEVTARYWRLRAEFTSAWKMMGIREYGANDAWWLGHVGQKIIFTTPPAVDEIITIAADVDTPWKTSDYVIDYSFTLSF